MAVIHSAGQGIPRRINSICDRVLLLGYMEDRKHLTVADVNEVVREFAEEGAIPAKKAPAVQVVNGATLELAARPLVDIDLSLLKINQAAAAGVTRKLDELDGQQREDRLRRLEESLMRLELGNLQLLAAVQELVRAIRQAGDAHSS
jgi:hypothetical protein